MKKNSIATYNCGYGKKNREFCFELQENGCWNCSSHFINSDGYPICVVNKKHKTVARVLYEHIFGTIPKEKVLRHTCDNPACVNPLHLLLGTHADNVADRVERGRSAIGSNHGRAKLTEDEARSIKKDNKTSTTDLARIHGVDRRVIYQIKNNLCWKHV